MNENQPNRRPVAISSNRRPMSEFAINMIKQQPSSPQDGARYKADNIINHELEMPLRTTYEYKNPKVSASLQAVLAEAMQTEDDIDITDQVDYCIKYCSVMINLILIFSHTLVK